MRSKAFGAVVGLALLATIWAVKPVKGRVVCAIEPGIGWVCR